MSGERTRLTLALLLSLLIHSLLLSLTFGGQTLGLPGFAFPWRERRGEAPDLRVVLMPARVTAAEPVSTSVKEPLSQVAIEQTVAGGPALTLPVPSPPIPGRTAEAIVFKAEATPTAQSEPVPEIATAAVSAAVPATVPAITPLRAEASDEVAPTLAVPTPIPHPVVIAVERSAEPTFVVPRPSPAPTPVIEAATGVSPPETVMPEREVQTQRQRQADQVEAARVDAAQQEAARQEAARVEAARLETARLDTQRQEAVRVAAAQQEVQRQELARQEAAQREAQEIGRAHV